MEEDECSNDTLPLTSSFHGGTSNYPVATRLDPKRPTLQFPNCPEEFEPPASPHLPANLTPPVIRNQRVVAVALDSHIFVVAEVTTGPYTKRPYRLD